MKRSLVTALAFLAAACGPVASTSDPGSPDAPSVGTSVFAPDSGVVFAGEKALELIEPCSRAAPGPVEGTWTPSESDIAALEPALSRHVSDRLRAEWSNDAVNVESYLRQYGGLIVDGRRVIVVNGFQASAAGDLDTWRSFPMVICDGGPIMFGAEYDVESRELQNFAFNGAI